MRVFRGFTHNFSRAIVAIGSFDGVHRGHRELIANLEREAVAREAEPVVVTFSQHPRQVLRGENRLLCSLDEKLCLLEEAGARNVVVVEFTVEFAKIEADVFVRDFLVGALGAVGIMMSSDHNFGKGGSGGVRELEKYGLEILSLGRYDEISSTMVRDALQLGDIEMVARLLGAPYLVRTPIEDDTKLFPPEGRYRCVVDSQEKIITISELKMMRERADVRIISPFVE
ncbi:MAG: FAD synthetase family protein [Rikenellaceae bacterium]